MAPGRVSDRGQDQLQDAAILPGHGVRQIHREAAPMDAASLSSRCSPPDKAPMTSPVMASRSIHHSP